MHEPGRYVRLKLQELDFPMVNITETELLQVRLRLEAGLPACITTPLVYSDGSKYVPVTEGESLLAWQILTSEKVDQECLLVSKPVLCDMKESGKLAPKEIIQDIRGAADYFDHMDTIQKKHTVDLLYEEFVRRTGRMDGEYKRARFRPKIEYINAITKSHMSNSTIVKYLQSSVVAKDRDEYYTLLADIEAEAVHYKGQFHGRTVFCPFDDPLASRFVIYFLMNFRRLGLKRLIATGFPICDETKTLVGENNALRLDLSYDHPKLKPDSDFAEDEANAFLRRTKDIFTVLQGDGKYSGGDFRGKDFITCLQDDPIVVTNPAFSQITTFVPMLLKYKIDMLIIAEKNCVAMKEIFPYIQAGILRSGTRPWNGGVRFETRYDDADTEVDGMPLKTVSAIWLTTLDHADCHTVRRLTAVYKGHEAEYPKYDTFNAINVDEIERIPYDYDGIMGVPITVLDRLCNEQFEIIGMDSPNDWLGHGPQLHGKMLYRRVIIKNRAPGFNDWDNWGDAV